MQKIRISTDSTADIPRELREELNIQVVPLTIINGEEQILEKGDIIAAMPGDTHQIACLGDEPLVLIAQVLYE